MMTMVKSGWQISVLMTLALGTASHGLAAGVFNENTVPPPIVPKPQPKPQPALEVPTPSPTPSSTPPPNDSIVPRLIGTWVGATTIDLARTMSFVKWTMTIVSKNEIQIRYEEQLESKSGYHYSTCDESATVVNFVILAR